MNKVKFKFSESELNVILSRLISLMSPNLTGSIKYLSFFISKIYSWTSHEGRGGLARIKLLADFITKRMLGLKCTVPPIGLKRFGRLLNLTGKNNKLSYKDKLCIITVMQFHRVVYLPVEYDTASITDRSIANWNDFNKV